MVHELRGKENLTEPADVIEAGSEWNGYQTWQCKMCPYNDTDHARTMGHVETIHKVFFGTRKVQSSLVDQNGQPLFMEVKHDGH